MRLIASRFFKVALSLAFLFLAQTGWAQPSAGPEHERMKGMDGKWNFVLKANDGTEAKGVSIMKIECGGLWLVSDFKCEMGGQPFQGKGLDGYDPVKKKYVTVWVDSYTTAPMLFEGKFDESGKVLTMTCEAPMGEESTPSTWRSVSKFVSNDEHIFEMFVKPKGGEEKSLMVVTYKRAK